VGNPFSVSFPPFFSLLSFCNLFFLDCCSWTLFPPCSGLITPFGGCYPLFSLLWSFNFTLQFCFFLVLSFLFPFTPLLCPSNLSLLWFFIHLYLLGFFSSFAFPLQFLPLHLSLFRLFLFFFSSPWLSSPFFLHGPNKVSVLSLAPLIHTKPPPLPLASGAFQNCKDSIPAPTFQR